MQCWEETYFDSITFFYLYGLYKIRIPVQLLFLSCSVSLFSDSQTSCCGTNNTTLCIVNVSYETFRFHPVMQIVAPIKKKKKLNRPTHKQAIANLLNGCKFVGQKTFT